MARQTQIIAFRWKKRQAKIGVFTITQVASYRNRCKPGGKSLSARSGLTNPLQTLPLNGLDMAIQVLDSRRSRSRAGLATSNLGYYTYRAPLEGSCMLYCPSIYITLFWSKRLKSTLPIIRWIFNGWVLLIFHHNQIITGCAQKHGLS